MLVLANGSTPGATDALSILAVDDASFQTRFSRYNIYTCAIFEEGTAFVQVPSLSAESQPNMRMKLKE